MIKWLNYFQNPSMHDRVIRKQSRDTNRETPCIYVSQYSAYRLQCHWIQCQIGYSVNFISPFFVPFVNLLVKFIICSVYCLQCQFFGGPTADTKRYALYCYITQSSKSHILLYTIQSVMRKSIQCLSDIMTISL